MARALAAAAIAGLVLGVGIAGGAPTAAQKCAYVVRWDGGTYLYLSRGDVRRGRRVGRGIRPGCNDIGGQPKPPDVPVEVFRFRTASPRVALTVREPGQQVLLVAVPGRCAGFGLGDRYRRCLAAELRFRGRGYSAMRGRALPRARQLGRGSLRGRPVQLEAVHGVDPRIALARRDKPLQLLVAHRRCELGAFSTVFMRCIRAPLWLRIEGSTAIRTGTIERPGSLLSNARLPLYLAPDAQADLVTAPEDERLTRAGHLNVDAKGRGSTRIAIVASLDTGDYAVMAELPSRRMVAVGALYVSNPPRRDSAS